MSASHQEHATSTISLLRDIQSGKLDPKCIDVSQRQQLVEFLLGDGYTVAEMAQILRVADRTIERDKKAIREAHAIERDPKLVGQMVGRLISEAELAVQRIRKALREKDVAPALRVDGEQRCFQIVNDLVARLQRVGYLPTATHKVEAELTHNMGELPDLPSMQSELQRLKQIQASTGNEHVQLNQLEEEITRAGIAARLEDAAQAIENGDVADAAGQ